MAMTLENSASETGTGTAQTDTLAFGFTATLNRLLIGIIGVDKDAGVITEDSTDWTLAKYVTDDDEISSAMFFKISDGTETDIIFNWTITDDDSMWMGEFSGNNVTQGEVLDGTAEGYSTSAVQSLAPDANLVTTNAIDMLIGYLGADSLSSWAKNESWTNSFVQFFEFASAGTGEPQINLARRDVIATFDGSTTASTDDTGDACSIILAGFKELASGLGVPEIMLVGTRRTPVNPIRQM